MPKNNGPCIQKAVKSAQRSIDDPVGLTRVNTENEVLIEENYICSQEFVNRTRTVFQTTDFFKTRVKKVLYH